MKDLWTYGPNRIAVQYEWREAGGRRYRPCDSELWEFDDAGLTRRREASIKGRPVAAGDRQFHGPAPSPRPHHLGFGLAVE